MSVIDGDVLCKLQGKTAAWTFTLDHLLHDTCDACQTSRLDCKWVVNIYVRDLCHSLKSPYMAQNVNYFIVVLEKVADPIKFIYIAVYAYLI